MTIKINLLILLLFALFYNCYSQNTEILDSSEYYCFEFIQYSTLNGKTDTIIKKICRKKRRVIFSKSRKYNYVGSVYNKEDELVSEANIILEGTEEIREDDNQQIYINCFFERLKDDSVKLQRYMSNETCCKWLDSLKTGVIEFEDKVWMHPIQHNQFILTEIAGFPDATLPLFIGKTWSTSLSIHSWGWGDWKNKKLMNNYKVLGLKKYVLNNETIECFEIECLTDFENGVNKHTYLFNSDYGFVLMQYEFYNGVKINFEMKGCITK